MVRSPVVCCLLCCFLRLQPTPALSSAASTASTAPAPVAIGGPAAAPAGEGVNTLIRRMASQTNGAGARDSMPPTPAPLSPITDRSARLEGGADGAERLVAGGPDGGDGGDAHHHDQRQHDRVFHRR